MVVHFQKLTNSLPVHVGVCRREIGLEVQVGPGNGPRMLRVQERLRSQHVCWEELSGGIWKGLD